MPHSMAFLLCVCLCVCVCVEEGGWVWVWVRVCVCACVWVSGCWSVILDVLLPESITASFLPSGHHHQLLLHDAQPLITDPMSFPFSYNPPLPVTPSLPLRWLQLSPLAWGWTKQTWERYVFRV